MDILLAAAGLAGVPGSGTSGIVVAMGVIEGSKEVQ